MSIVSKLCNFYSPDNFWMKMVFLISGLSLTLLLSIALPPYSIIFLIPSMFIALIVWIYLVFKYNILEKIWVKSSKFFSILALLFSGGSVWLFSEMLYRDAIAIFEKLDGYVYPFFESLSTYSLPESVQKYLALLPNIYQYHDLFLAGFLIVVSFLSLLVLFLIWKYLLTLTFPILKDFFRGLDKIERWYLCGILAIALVSIPLIYNITSIFYYPIDATGILNGFSGIYGADTGSLVGDNAYGNINHPENDIRQLLFGLFALPFSLLAFFVSKIFFFVPSAYPITLGILQIFSAAVIAVLIGRLLKAEKISKVLLFALFTFSYPTLLFSFVLEQYVFATLWLILFIYSVCTNGKFKKWFFVGACGTLSTSLITFPLLARKLDIKKYLSVAALFFILAVVCGRFWKICYSVVSLISLSGFTGVRLGIPFIDRVLQYLNFTALNFFTPATVVVEGEKFMLYAQSQELSLNVLGIMVICVSVIGFILNSKNIYAKICFGMMIFSFVILCLIGWNTGENALALQSFYFSWAFISLVYLAIHKLFLSHPKIQFLIFALLIAAMICINIPGIYDVIQFGIQYYPVR